MRGKSIAVLVLFALVVSGFAIIANSDHGKAADGGKCGNNVEYQFDPHSGTLTISGTGPMNNYPDGGTTNPYYGQRGNITKIVIGEGVTSIGDHAFLGCSVTSVGIPSTVTSVGKGAFKNCGQLSELKIPDSVKTIGNYTFQGCTSLASVTIGESVESVGVAAFEGCTSLTDISFPDSVKTIGTDAFGSTKFFVNGPDGKYGVECNADNLKGRGFTGTYDKMYEKSKFRVCYVLDGKPVTIMEICQEKKNVHVIDITGYVKKGHSAVWESNDVLIRGDGTFDMGKSNVTIFAVSVPDGSPDRPGPSPHHSSAKGLGNLVSLAFAATVSVSAALVIAAAWHAKKQS